MKLTYLALPAALLATSLFAACQNTARGLEQDTEKNAAAAKEATREAGYKAEQAGQETKAAAEKAADATRNAAGNAVDATKDAASKTADATKDAASDVAGATKRATAELGSKVDAAQQTMDVKMALMADKTVDASGINVDTNADAKTVTLKGHVKTSAEKARAEEIARTKASGYRVVNNLVVG